jgi:hypothetical protein
LTVTQPERRATPNVAREKVLPTALFGKAAHEDPQKSPVRELSPEEVDWGPMSL